MTTTHSHASHAPGTASDGAHPVAQDAAPPAATPFSWGVGGRLLTALGLVALLWLAVSWALDWWS